MIRGAGPAGAHAHVLLFALILALGSCRSPGFDSYEEAPGAYDRLSPLQLEALGEARALLEEDQLEPARRRLASLAAATPDNLVVATLLQEVELELLELGLTVPGVALGQEDLIPTDRLLPRYAQRAEQEGTASAYVLAARLATDGRETQAWLDAALAVDPTCVWAHYALAWVYAGSRRFAEAQAALGRALELDPGHPPSRRLEAALLARSGDVERALTAHELWLDRYASDVRVAPRRVAEARLDLAGLRVVAGEPGAALDALAELDPRQLSDVNMVALTRATALEMLGRPEEALAEARRAAEEAPLDVRPRLQQALLLSEHFDDGVGARAAWEEILRLLDEPGEEAAPASDPAATELASLFVRLQARAALARLDRIDERAGAEDSTSKETPIAPVTGTPEADPQADDSKR